MREKLLALLVAKFLGVPEATLERIATKKAGSVSDESQLQSIVDGIDFGQILQSEVDSKITDANKKAVQNYETAHKLKDGKPVDPITADPDPDKDKNKDIAKIIADAVSAAVKPLQEKMSSIESGKTLGIRKQSLEAVLKDVPESFKAQKLKDFERMSFEKDEDFSAYLTETEANVAALSQELADNGLSGHGTPSVFGAKDKDGVSKATQDYITSQSKSQDNLGGKELKTH